MILCERDRRRTPRPVVGVPPLPPVGALWSLLVDHDGRYVDADEGGLGMLGLTRDELRGGHVGDHVPEDYREAVRTTFATMQAGLPRLVVYEIDVVRPDGAAVRAHLLPPEPRPDGALLIRGYRADGGHGLGTAEPSYILGEWRAAERRRDATPPGSPECEAAEREVASLRLLYQYAARERR